jgi:2-aminobenzoate-CoA ligase
MSLPTSAGPASITIRRRVEWSDTDASGWYHNTAAFRWIEAAETTLLARLGFIGDIYGRHPRVHIEADFLSTLHFHDLVDVECRVEQVGTTSVTYAFRILRGEDVTVRARMVTVLLDRPEGTPAEWPQEYRRLLLEAGEQDGNDLA